MMRFASWCVVAALAGSLVAGGPVAVEATAVAAEVPTGEAASPVAQDLSNDLEAVGEVQRALTELGYDPGPADGVMGPRTRSAIRAFQSSRGMTSDGIVSTALLGELEEARAEAKPAPQIGGTAVVEDATRSAPQPARQRSPDEVNACDLLAGKGMDLKDLDGPRALDACRRARAEFPEVSRFAFQEAMALWKLERYGEARTILEQLADANDPRAHLYLGMMHEQGLGLPSKDVREAVARYRRAAELGHSWAQMKLGRALSTGELGLRRNDDEALRWLRSAAEGGEPYAAMFIGYSYETGRGVPVDTAEALRWYRRAADGGDQWALEQVERFDPAGAREIRESLRQREETKRAEIAARKREAEALLAAEAPELPQVAEDQSRTLKEAVEDLSWTVAEKIDADVTAVARALREMHDETRGTETIFAPLAAVRAEHVGPNRDEDAAGGVASLWWRLALASVGGGDSNQAPVDRAQAQLMVEVANRYDEPSDQEAALQLYLLGFRNLDSPVELPEWLFEGGQARASGAQAAAQHLRQRLEMLGEKLAEQPLPADDQLEPSLERLKALTAAVATSRSGLVEIPGIGDAQLTRQLGAVGGLAQLRAEIASHPATEGTVSLRPDLHVATVDGFQIASLTVAGRVEDGTELARVEQQFPLPTGASLPDLSGVQQAGAHDLRRELSEVMLIALPMELANLWWLTEDIIKEVWGAIGEPDPNPWSPRFEKARAATPPVAATDAKPEIAVTRSEPRATAVGPEAAASESSRTVEVGLRDGSTMTAQLVSGSLTFKSMFGELPVALDELADLSEGGLRLQDGTVLRGELVGGEIVIATPSGQRALAASEIARIALIDETRTRR
jgi:TPR repeat protein